MKIKDLDAETNLENVKVKTPKGVIGYWKSQWAKGVWLSDGKTSRIYPQFVDNIKDTIEWEIVNGKTKVNCHKKTDLTFIDNCKNEDRD